MAPRTLASATRSCAGSSDLARALVSRDLKSSGNVVATGLRGAAGDRGLERPIDSALR